MSLFLFDKKDRCVVNPDALKLTVYLKKVSNDQFYYLVLAYDHDSPYHQYPEDDRKLKARRQVFKTGSMDDIEAADPILAEAAKEYQALQYDPIKAIRSSYIEKLVDLNKKLMQETDMSALQRIDKTIEVFEKRLEKIQDKLNKAAQENNIKGKRKLTFIEEWQANQAAYNRDKNNGSETFEEVLN